MAKQLSFKVEYIYPDHPDGITVTVSLGYGDKTIITDAKVDTGATYCLFRHEHGRELSEYAKCFAVMIAVQPVFTGRSANYLPNNFVHSLRHPA